MSESPPRSDAPGLASRRLAWDVLEAVAAGAYADVALERALRHRPLGSADRGLATELAYGAIRWRQWLDAWIDKLGKVPACKQPPRLRWLLHIGLYQVLRMERIPAAGLRVFIEHREVDHPQRRPAVCHHAAVMAKLHSQCTQCVIDDTGFVGTKENQIA